jgi:hypothetical protein
MSWDLFGVVVDFYWVKFDVDVPLTQEDQLGMLMENFILSELSQHIIL